MEPAHDRRGALDVAVLDESIDGESREPPSLPGCDVLIADVPADVLLDEPHARTGGVERSRLRESAEGALQRIATAGDGDPVAGGAVVALQHDRIAVRRGKRVRAGK